ncbi:MAG: amino acid ABC transporter permease [Anaerolineales bacterium]|nr:amino acid ABC transporter permease [Anaerolineales bacterium]
MTETFTGLIPYILTGLQVTLEVTILALGIGFIIGLGLALVRVYGSKTPAQLIAVVSVIIRALPHILLLLLMYFAIAALVNLTPFWAGSLSLAIISSAYQSEILRGALLSVGSGQMMAARTLGMTRVQAIRHIILPQALRQAIPAWSNEAAIIVKDSSLVYVLGVPEILRKAQYYSARTYQPFTAFIAVAVVYFVLTFLTNRGLCALERKLKIPGQ